MSQWEHMEYVMGFDQGQWRDRRKAASQMAKVLGYINPEDNTDPALRDLRAAARKQAQMPHIKGPRV